MIRVIIINKDKTIKEKRIRPRRDFIYKGGLYILDSSGVNLWENQGKIMGSEVIFFEENPLPLSIEDNGESVYENVSLRYLDDYVLINALKQTARERVITLSWLRELKDYLSPQILIWILFVGVIVYGLIVGGLPI